MSTLSKINEISLKITVPNLAEIFTCCCVKLKLLVKNSSEVPEQARTWSDLTHLTWAGSDLAHWQWLR